MRNYNRSMWRYYENKYKILYNLHQTALSPTEATFYLVNAENYILRSNKCYLFQVFRKFIYPQIYYKLIILI